MEKDWHIERPVYQYSSDHIFIITMHVLLIIVNENKK